MVNLGNPDKQLRRIGCSIFWFLNVYLAGFYFVVDVECAVALMGLIFVRVRPLLCVNSKKVQFGRDSNQRLTGSY